MLTALREKCGKGKEGKGKEGPSGCDRCLRFLFPSCSGRAPTERQLLLLNPLLVLNEKRSAQPPLCSLFLQSLLSIVYGEEGKKTNTGQVQARYPAWGEAAGTTLYSCSRPLCTLSFLWWVPNRDAQPCALPAAPSTAQRFPKACRDPWGAVVYWSHGESLVLPCCCWFSVRMRN